MAITQQAAILGITDCKIAAVTTNTATSYVKGSYIDVPGITEVTCSVILNEKDVTGDEVMLNGFSIKMGYDITFSNQLIDLPTLALINGGTIATSGTTPDEIVTFTEKSSDNTALFDLQFKTDYVDGDPADFHMEFYCVKGYMDVKPVSGDLYSCSFKGKAYARLLDKAFRVVTLNETSADIA